MAQWIHWLTIKAHKQEVPCTHSDMHSILMAKLFNNHRYISSSKFSANLQCMHAHWGTTISSHILLTDRVHTKWLYVSLICMTRTISWLVAPYMLNTWHKLLKCVQHGSQYDRFLFQRCVANISHCPTNQTVNARDIIWLVKQILFPMTLTMLTASYCEPGINADGNNYEAHTWTLSLPVQLLLSQ